MFEIDIYHYTRKKDWIIKIESKKTHYTDLYGYDVDLTIENRIEYIFELSFFKIIFYESYRENFYFIFSKYLEKVLTIKYLPFFSIQRSHSFSGFTTTSLGLPYEKEEKFWNKVYEKILTKRLKF